MWFSSSGCCSPCRQSPQLCSEYLCGCTAPFDHMSTFPSPSKEGVILLNTSCHLNHTTWYSMFIEGKMTILSSSQLSLMERTQSWKSNTWDWALSPYGMWISVNPSILHLKGHLGRSFTPKGLVLLIRSSERAHLSWCVLIVNARWCCALGFSTSSFLDLQCTYSSINNVGLQSLCHLFPEIQTVCETTTQQYLLLPGGKKERKHNVLFRPQGASCKVKCPSNCAHILLH